METSKLQNGAQSRLASLREKREKCIIANKADRAAEIKSQKDRSAEYKLSTKLSDEPNDTEEGEEDRLGWTTRQWENYERKRTRTKKSGYKSHFDLAHSTYLKETSRKPVNKEKYQKNAEETGSILGVRLAREDVDELAQSLQDTSERRAKRRRTQASGGDFITEKNRQFNMKLDREYGKEEE